MRVQCIARKDKQGRNDVPAKQKSKDCLEKQDSYGFFAATQKVVRTMLGIEVEEQPYESSASRTSGPELGIVLVSDARDARRNQRR